MTYSLNFRQKVLAIKEQEGLTGKEASVRFGIGEANITRWNKCLEPQRMRNKAATKLDMEALEQDVKEFPMRISMSEPVAWESVNEQLAMR